MKKLLFAMIALLSLAACQPSPEKEDKLSKWYGGSTKSETVDGETRNLETKLACRVLSEDKKTHMYYYLDVDPKTFSQNTETATSTYERATLSITRVEVQEEAGATRHMFLSLNAVKLEIVPGENGLVLYRSVALNDISKEVRKGDEYMAVSEYYGSYNNQTKTPVPGLKENQAMDCSPSPKE